MVREMLKTNVILGKSSYLIHSLLISPLLVIYVVHLNLLPLLLLAASVSFIAFYHFFFSLLFLCSIRVGDVDCWCYIHYQGAPFFPFWGGWWGEAESLFFLQFSRFSTLSWWAGPILGQVGSWEASRKHVSRDKAPQKHLHWFVLLIVGLWLGQLLRPFVSFVIFHGYSISNNGMNYDAGLSKW